MENTTPATPVPPPAALTPPVAPGLITAVIDIGATAIRMEVAELKPDGEVHSLASLSNAVHLGKDTFTKGRISQPTIEEAVRILRNYRRVMEEYGVREKSQIRAVATSSVREAANRDTFLDRVYMATRINVEAIEEAEEIRLAYLAVQQLLRTESELQKGDVLVVEIGGGDSELLLIQDGFVNYSNTFRLGALRMREQLGGKTDTPQRLLATFTKHIQLSVDQIQRSLPPLKSPTLVAMSGDARFAATQMGANKEGRKIARLDVKALTTLARKIATASIDSLVIDYRIPYQSAETLGPALLAYAQMAKVFQIEKLVVPNVNLRYGLLQEVATGGVLTKEFGEQVLHSAISLGTKYGFDIRHARQVADICVRMFRELKEEHLLAPRYELILHVAALLHEIGLFISTRSHHKHSMYLIQNSEVFGLSSHDVQLCALIARYHRRAAPQPYHEGFTTLDRDDRLVVSKLSAILRVADALDRNHMQQVRDVTFSREGGQFVITVLDVEDLTLERLALKEKGNVFEEVYGMKVVFRAASPTEGIIDNV